VSVKEVKGRPGWFDVAVYDRVRAPGARPAKIQRRVKGQRAAERLERDLKNKREAGSLVDRNTPLSDYATAYLKSRRAEVSRQTLHGYQVQVDRYISRHPIGRARIGSLTTTMVAEFYADLLSGENRDTVDDDGKVTPAAPISRQSVTGVHRVLSMILKRATVDGLLHANPCTIVKPPKDDDVHEDDDEQGDEDEPGVDPETAVAFLKMAEGTAIYTLAAVALGTGLRRSELLALRWRDIDLEAGELKVRGKIEQVGKHVERRAPKSKRSRRTVPFGPSVAKVLRRQRAIIAEHKLQYRGRLLLDGEDVPAWVDEGWVFPALRMSRAKDGTHLPAGRLWTPNALAQQWRQCRDSINQKRLKEWLDGGHREEDFDKWTFGPHALRHCYGTVQLAAGVRIELVSRRLGHSSSAVTARIYSHVIKSELRDGVDVADSLI